MPAESLLHYVRYADGNFRLGVCPGLGFPGTGGQSHRQYRGKYGRQNGEQGIESARPFANSALQIEMLIHQFFEYPASLAILPAIARLGTDRLTEIPHHLAQFIYGKFLGSTKIDYFLLALLQFGSDRRDPRGNLKRDR